MQKRNKESESESATSKFVESERTPGRTSFISSVSQISGSASCESKSLTARESEAIFVIKQLQDQVLYMSSTLFKFKILNLYYDFIIFLFHVD